MANAKKASLRDKAIEHHRKFLRERKVGLTHKQTRTSKEILGRKYFGDVAIPERRKKQLRKIMGN
jgi:hypothetical protein